METEAKNLKVGDKIKIANYSKYQEIENINKQMWGLPTKYRNVTIFLKGRKPITLLSVDKILKYNN